MKFSINKKFRSFKPFFLIVVVFVFCFNIQTSFAKEYYYKNFEVDIKINEDSTFDVTEKQTYYLDGSFGFFNRDISHKNIDAITNVEVFDGETKKISKSELEIKSKIGETHIQWNFPRRIFLGEEKSWTVKYKVHGVISFLKNYYEIYWNAIPSARDVAIKDVKVTVSLPSNEKFKSDLIKLYAEDIPKPILDCLQCGDEAMPIDSGRNEAVPRSYGVESNSISIGGYYFNQSNTQAVFWGRNLRPNTNFTIAVGFPKGIVSQSAYYKDFLMIYYGYILSVIIFLSCIIIGFIYWYKTERSREGKRAIVPQYEPPQNLRPAMAEVIVKEKLTNKGLAATIIDLAVRGYVRIEKDEKSKLKIAIDCLVKILPIIMFIIVFASVFIIIKSPLYNSENIPFFQYIIFILFPAIMFVGIFSTLFKNKKPSDYTITKTKSYNNDSNLEDYEKKYLNALFSSKDYFSTREMKRNQMKARVLYKKIKKVKDKIYEETELDTRAFERGLTIEKRKKIIWTILAFIIFFSFQFFFASVGISQLFILVLTIIVSVVGLYAFIKYEARLSDQGIKLKEDWLGFKMYLEIAEKYRMQNLKPEFFEKYLPYAMIFGVEKKWAKAFETLHIAEPSWYVGSVYTTGSSSNSASSFSPSAFSASFTSSFTSAFSSSGAGGASGGGGGAGGGGGGGGGGAG
ncbi:MAG: DUF2207 domain-containing protein [Patescibacteria group bacterium]|nr:DUF2207 domain-containing protein [Patescibacteria group bacterium]